MNGLAIHINWEYFLGIMGALIVGAWYANGRFTTLETSMRWVQDVLKELRLSSSGIAAPAFDLHSPIGLSALGVRYLNESGFRKYIDAHQPELYSLYRMEDSANPYELQQHIFKAFNDMRLESAFEDSLKRFAFEKGITTDVLRRIGAIYFRDLCLGIPTPSSPRGGPGSSC